MPAVVLRHQGEIQKPTFKIVFAPRIAALRSIIDVVDRVALRAGHLPVQPGGVFQRLPPRRREANPVGKAMILKGHTVHARLEPPVEFDQQVRAAKPVFRQ